MTLRITIMLMALIVASICLADVPRNISYQGYLTDSMGDPIEDGVYTVLFSIYGVSSGGTALWSGAGSVETKDGVFGHLLGSANALSATVFADTARWLGITVQGDQEIVPRTKLSAVPYAYQALRSDTADYVLNSINTCLWSPGGAAAIYYNGGNVGIGITTPLAKLHVDGDIRTSSSYRINGHAVLMETNTGSNLCVGRDAGTNSVGSNGTFVGKNAGNVDEGNGNTYIGNYAGQDSKVCNYNTFVGYGAGNDNVIGANNTYVGAGAGWESNGSGNVFIGKNAGYASTGDNELWIANSTADPLIYGDFEASEVGIGTENPMAKLDVRTNVATAIRGSTTGDEGSCGVYGLAYSLNSYGVYGEATTYSGTGVLGIASNLDGGNGVYGVAQGANGFGVYGRASGDNGAGVYATSVSSNATALVVDGHLNADWAVDIRGNLRIKNQSGVSIVELGEGLDYAEGFNTTNSSKIAPGTVMIIDPLNPGQLTVGKEPYDSRVAGIVAGANGLGSGVRLGADQFDIDVALAGRVYCNVDATQAGIEPGDLLTTSSCPGYAMKAIDATRTPGAILGKAMESLERGQKGMILVLVTLQ